MNKSPIKYLIAFFISSVVLTVTIDAKIYRYKNAEGKTVNNSILPPEVSQNGYEILNDQGIVIETVAPRKTAEQLRLEVINKKQLAAEAKRRREQEQLDTILINSYTDLSDIERARDNELGGKDRDINLLKQNVRRLTRLLEDIQKRAARDERLGRELSKQILSDIESFKKRIASEEKEVIRIEAEKITIYERYASSIIRFSELKAAEQLRRYRPGDLASNDSKAVIYQCDSTENCASAWQRSLRYASDNSTTELAWANEVTIMMRKPTKKHDISIMVTMVKSRSAKYSSIVMEVRCNKSLSGEEFCNSEKVRTIEKGFLPYLN